MKLKRLTLPLMALACGLSANATPVKVIMNNESKFMTLVSKDTDTAIEVGEPVKQEYTFDVPAGDYILTGVAKDETTINGTILISVIDSDVEQEFKILTCTAYVTNKHEDGSFWTIDNGDYTLDVTVNSREGVRQVITVGNSTTAGRNTFLALNGNSYNVAFIPSDEHKADNYTTLYKSGTLTFNVNINGAIPVSHDYSISVPSEAELFLGMKFTHFTDFTPVEPKNIEDKGDSKVYTYFLAEGQVYNYRTWIKGELTQAGYFTMSGDEAKCPVINFTAEDYKAFNSKQINHDVQSNNGFETGDIFVNINHQGYL
ncbi:MAG: hypothetical protein K2K94_06680, partial [Muribaculaceae bacterium]|nr:hypothetical protein [Muribaculaceae bacterium]